MRGFLSMAGALLAIAPAPGLAQVISSTAAVPIPATATFPLAVEPSTAVPNSAAPTGWFELYDSNEGTKFCRGCASCLVLFGGGGALGCNSSAAIGNAHCSDLNGRVSVANCDGILTVDFPSTVTDLTPVHFEVPDGRYVGGDALNKVSGPSFTYHEQGTGSWGSPSYVGGWCTADIIQYQKQTPSDPATSTTAQYSYNVSFWDTSTPPVWIGGTTGGPVYIPENVGVTIDSILPKPFQITSSGQDAQPYTISFNNVFLPQPNNQIFSAYDPTHYCLMAGLAANDGSKNWGYENGARSNTCGFAC